MTLKNAGTKVHFIILLLAIIAVPAVPQTSLLHDPASCIGFTLTELIGHYGVPRSVRASRGIEEWQDDVVFVYDTENFYIVNDRVWQIEVKSAYLINSGDPGSSVFLRFGEAVARRPDYAVFRLNGYSWPLEIRFNFNAAGIITMIYIYRSDL